MRAIDIEKWGRQRTYDWFRTFSNSTYTMNVRMDVTELVRHAKEHGQSFFIDLLYIVMKGLSSIDEMRMRLVDGKPVIFDEINPAFTVMTEAGLFENVRYDNEVDFDRFYKVSEQHIEKAKNQSDLDDADYNPENRYDEFYITCVPWVDFEQFTHPIPDDIASQCIPRVCWGKYEERKGRLSLMLNITVSHIFVDGYPLACAFNKIQELLNDVSKVLA